MVIADPATARSPEAVIAEAFHRAYYDSGVWDNRTFWLGVPVYKLPLDLWVYQELLSELRPDVIIETGSALGGSALYLASLCDLLAHGEVISVDIHDLPFRPEHPRLTYMQGSSTAPLIVNQIRTQVGERTALVILDAAHDRDHVLAELQAYAPLIRPGGYLIVEDTNLGGRPVQPDFGPGPAEAVEAFLAAHPEFEADHSREKFHVSFNAGGYLRRNGRPSPGETPLLTFPASPLIDRPPLAVVPLPSEVERLALQARTLYIVDRDDTNQGTWRTVWPCLQAAAHGGIADWVNIEGLPSIAGWLDAGRYNVVITPRFNAQWRNREGLTWLYECDDDLFTDAFVARQVEVFGHPLAEVEEARQGRLQVLQECDGIMVSREPLAAVVRQYTDKPILVVPNAIDVGWFRARLRNRDRILPPLTIGWSGASRELADFEQIAAAWHTIARRYPAVRFVVQGNAHAHPLINAVPADRLTILPWTTVDQHPATLLNIDIACCGVADTTWNLSKSPNKWLEASLAGSASVVSQTLYGEYVEHGETGLVAASASDWESSLAWLIDNENDRVRLNMNAQRVVETEHSIERQWWRWPHAWGLLRQAAQSNARPERQSNADRNAAART